MAEHSWWQGAVIYQILVRSFRDTNGDGQGDLSGVIEKLEYVKWVGADAIWLTPIFPSPWCDGGYDVSDFTGVHPLLGRIEDVDRLLAEAHKRSLRVVLDWVINHTSDQHPWFVESRASRDNPKRDWYVWADGKPDGAPPSNWMSVFGGSAWTADPATGQHYYHAFLPEQPDLNWRNPAVVEAMHEAMRFWLRRGVDGFRLDAIDMLIESGDVVDNPANPDFNPSTDAPDQAVLQEHTRHQPALHDQLIHVRSVVDEFQDRVLLGEVYLPIEQVVAYYGCPERPEIHLPLNLGLLWTDWRAEAISESITRYAQLLPPHGWPAWSLGNHDRSRIASRIPREQVRVAAMLTLTLRGTPTIYYGDEIGMHDVAIPPHQSEDPQAKAQPQRSRDPARTPMQWDAAPHAGFTTGEPYLPVSADFAERNVNVQSRDPRSTLSLYRKLIQLRKDEAGLALGAHTEVQHRAPVVTYRRDGARHYLIVLNLSGDAFSFNFKDHGERGDLLISTFLDRENEPLEGEVSLRGHEGVIIVLK